MISSAVAVLATAMSALMPLGGTALPTTTEPSPSPVTTADAPAADDARVAWAVTPADESGPDGRGRFDLLVEPGGIVEEHVAVRNFGHEDLEVELSVRDASQTPGTDFAVLSEGEVPERVAAWVELEETSVLVPARSSVVVPVLIRVPADAEPGDHAGGILALSAVEFDDETIVNYEVGTRVYLRIAGPVTPSLAVDPAAAYSGRLSPFALGSAQIDTTVANMGNVRVAPQMRARVTSLFGWWETTVPLSGVPELLPEGSAQATADLDGVPALGPLWVTVEVGHAVSLNQDVTQAVQVEGATTVVWAVPWVFVAFVLALLIALGIGIRNWRRRRAVSQDAQVGLSAEDA